MPWLAMIIPPVGKSGAGIYFIISSRDMFLLSMYATMPSMDSPKECGGMLVASPTAIPLAPLTSKLGILLGNTAGSSNESSKLSVIGTVFLSKSLNISRANGVILASVYLIAAALSPSTEPKLPCPSTSNIMVLKGCANLTIAPYTDESP